jgi:hypothetical protein
VLRATPAGRQHDGRSSVPEYRWRAENNLRQIKSLIERCLNWQWEYSPMRRAVHSTQHPASKSRRDGRCCWPHPTLLEYCRLSNNAAEGGPRNDLTVPHEFPQLGAVVAAHVGLAL